MRKEEVRALSPASPEAEMGNTVGKDAVTRPEVFDSLERISSAHGRELGREFSRGAGEFSRNLLIGLTVLALAIVISAGLHAYVAFYAPHRGG